ncbi:hypothetical protein [Acinetobacter terrestris]|jgi:hypothetical protein|uniref:hypothetical protein n=1 Tax=Acinetobacter TaxID=469 RepID=UPI00103F3207|nr:hypothetical protein [Acinetobacter terrestris]TCB50282.1 hypothetical protein E0H84_15075 [Acinetobacter terrestris]
MFGSKRSIFVILVVISSFTSVSALASMQIIHSVDFSSQPQKITNQTKSVVEIKNCKNNEEGRTVEVKNTSK